MSENGAHIVVLSAKNQDRLKAIVQQQLDYLNKQQELSLQDYAYTLQIRPRGNGRPPGARRPQ